VGGGEVGIRHFPTGHTMPDGETSDPVGITESTCQINR
jgi:hypothetical protein